MTAVQLDFATAARTVGPWRAGQPDTARAAAIANYAVKGKQAREVLAALVAAGPWGLTAHEVAAACPSISAHYIASTRMAELADGGKAAVRYGRPLVERTGRTRPAPSGRDAHVWVALPAAVEALR